ncbi:MAG: dethiobiotin synthase [Myxococcales bacterium]|nr:dethiobiotin synthase [Myxococcales bacterium]
MRGLFVTGTDTDVGKTTVSLALLRAAAQRGLSIAAMKAVETGCRREADQLVPADALHLRAACWPSSPPPIELVCPHRFEPPVAPSVAARAAGERIDLERIDRAHATLAGSDPDLLLVEGAGGLLVPLDDDGLTIADLAARLGHPLLVVARDRLGMISHTLLTLEVAAARGLPVAGVILNVVDEHELVPSNLDELLRHARVPVLGRMPALPRPDPTAAPQLGAIAERSLELDRLLGPRAQ